MTHFGELALFKVVDISSNLITLRLLARRTYIKVLATVLAATALTINDVIGNSGQCKPAIAENSGRAATASAKISGSSIRILKFPEKSIGSLLLIPPGRNPATTIRQLVGAQGVIRVVVPPHNLLMFEPNQRAFLHPEVLDGITADGIDVLKLSFYSMEEKEDKLCDNALRHLSSFSKLNYLSVANSDTTDEGIINMTPLPNLKILSVSQTHVNGKCLQDSDRWKALQQLEMNSCFITIQSVQRISKLSGLFRLQLAGNRLTDEILTNLYCQNLQQLDLSKNVDLDDKCIPALLRMKNLKELNLSSTKISPAGLARLAPLKLEKIWLPQTSYLPEKDGALKKIFGTSIQYLPDNRKKVNDVQKMLAPISN